MSLISVLNLPHLGFELFWVCLFKEQPEGRPGLGCDCELAPRSTVDICQALPPSAQQGVKARGSRLPTPREWDSV